MKKAIYLTTFTIFGVLITFLSHSLIEIWYIDLLINDFQKYSFGFSWDQWFVVHWSVSIILFVLGAIIGYYQGIFWWKKFMKNRLI